MSQLGLPFLSFPCKRCCMPTFPVLLHLPSLRGLLGCRKGIGVRGARADVRSWKVVHIAAAAAPIHEVMTGWGRLAVSLIPHWKPAAAPRAGVCVALQGLQQQWLCSTCFGALVAIMWVILLKAPIICCSEFAEKGCRWLTCSCCCLIIETNNVHSSRNGDLLRDVGHTHYYPWAGSCTTCGLRVLQSQKVSAFGKPVCIADVQYACLWH